MTLYKIINNANYFYFSPTKNNVIILSQNTRQYSCNQFMTMNYVLNVNILS